MSFYELLFIGLAWPVLTGALAYLGRDVIGKWVQGRIEQRFNEKIEILKSDLREKEQVLAADLRSKEAEISALRNGALTGLTGRQALLEKRRIESIEKLWIAVSELRSVNPIASVVAMLHFEKAADAAKKDKNTRDAFREMFKAFGIEKLKPQDLTSERPFLSPVVWALYSAYQGILLSSVAQAMVLQTGVGSEMLDSKHTIELIKSVLPHQEAYIGKYGPTAAYHLLPEIEGKILEETKRMLEGVQADEQALRRASEILKLSTEIQEKTKVTEGSEKLLEKFKN